MFITARTIEECWYRFLYSLRDNGRDFEVERGSYGRKYRCPICDSIYEYNKFITICKECKSDLIIEKGSIRRQFDFAVGRITAPWMRPLAPIIPEGLNISPPTSNEKIEKYFLKYIIGTEKEEGEQYTYGERINESLYEVIEMLRKTPMTNQAVIQVGRHEDIYLEDPPCLRTIGLQAVYLKHNEEYYNPFTEMICINEDKDNIMKLNICVDFRSWDLFNGFPENLGGLELLLEYITLMVNRIDLFCGEMYVTSKGLHVYNHAFQFVDEMIWSKLPIKDVY